MSKWRNKWKVHPVADMFPMLPPEKLKELSDDIKENALLEPYEWWRSPDGEKELTDGRNRMEACEMAGVDPGEGIEVYGDVVGRIISKNIHRRHLTLAEQLDLLATARVKEQAAKVASTADKYVDKDGTPKPGQPVQVSKGGRGKKNPIKEKVKADAKKAGIKASDKSVQRAVAKAEGRAKKKPDQSIKAAAKPKPKPSPVFNLAEARDIYADHLARLDDDDLSHEIAVLEARIKAIRNGH
jgi:hypothetical protein